MQINKLSVLAVLLLIKLTSFADIALPKHDKLQEAKYYFANVDSFRTYTFYVKKSSNQKTYKIKQDAAFLIKPESSKGDERLEVWAVKTDDGSKTNSFTLTTVKQDDIYLGNTAYIAILFSFDKKGNLTYKKTVLKPDCYNNKKSGLPFLSFHIPGSNHNTGFAYLSLISVLFMLTVVIYKKKSVRNAYS